MKNGTLLILIGIFIEIIAIYLYASSRGGGSVFLATGVVFIIIGLARNKTTGI